MTKCWPNSYQFGNRLPTNMLVFDWTILPVLFVPVKNSSMNIATALLYQFRSVSSFVMPAVASFLMDENVSLLDPFHKFSCLIHLILTFGHVQAAAFLPLMELPFAALYMRQSFWSGWRVPVHFKTSLCLSLLVNSQCNYIVPKTVNARNCHSTSALMRICVYILLNPCSSGSMCYHLICILFVASSSLSTRLHSVDSSTFERNRLPKPVLPSAFSMEWWIHRSFVETSGAGSRRTLIFNTMLSCCSLSSSCCSLSSSCCVHWWSRFNTEDFLVFANFQLQPEVS